ncbi:hypothetical protein GW764_01305 [Candidatus Parcubacteria bacterium]|nr:hypothetical protein [Candidatus Parcubacteria bacterium]
MDNYIKLCITGVELYMEEPAMSEKTTQNSTFRNSLLYGALKTVLDEIKSPENQWYAGEHFHNDPSNHPGERLLYYLKTGRVSKVFFEFKEKHPELVWGGRIKIEYEYSEESTEETENAQLVA